MIGSIGGVQYIAPMTQEFTYPPWKGGVSPMCSPRRTEAWRGALGVLPVGCRTDWQIWGLLRGGLATLSAEAIGACS